MGEESEEGEKRDRHSQLIEQEARFALHLFTVRQRRKDNNNLVAWRYGHDDAR